ncbi:MAG: type II toxin-antitoxin system RelE/ParE family toxin [Campylobacterales bacterium]|nr:type II toxin-antitoxin system RelE/ParE family toxin [Campylobacterales bacterium]
MTYSIVVEPEALLDLQNIYNYISIQDSANKAKNFILELQKNINSLNEMPHRCRKSYYVDDENIRDFIYKKYTIVFKIVDSNVHILTLFRQREF